MEHVTHSHPNEPVRHSYDVQIKDAGIGTAFSLLMKTSPYLLVRFGILMMVSIITWVGAVLAFGGLALLSQRVHNIVGFVWFFGICGILGALYQFFGRYTLYLIKCGHIAVLTELLTKGSIANGSQSMFSYGKQVVTEKFGQVNILFVVDSLIRGVVRAFNRTLNWVTNLIPIPGLSSITGVINSILYASTTYIDETIFSYNLARGDSNPWRSSRDGLVYYAQNAKPILKTAIWSVVLDKVLTVVIWAMMLIPAGFIVYLIPFKGLSFVTLIIAFTMAINLRSTIIKPMLLVMIMTRFHTEAQNQPINESWDAKLNGISDKFGELKDKALGFGETPSTTVAEPALS